MKKVHNKLVRDRIPEILDAKGVSHDVSVASDDECAEKLKDKLREEVEELLLSDSQEAVTEELADVYEVLDAITEHHGLSGEKVREAQAEKRETRGGFEKRIILNSTEEDV